MKLRYILLSAALVAALGACSNGSSSTDSASGAAGDDTAAAVVNGPDVKVEGNFGEDPKVENDWSKEPPKELLIQDLIEGDGEAIQEGATVEVHYKGVSWKNKGTVFDSSFERGETVSFPLDGVITGWRDGLVGQKVNGRRLLVIPPELAYGDATVTPAIAPNDTLVFVVDLVSIPQQGGGQAPATPAAEAPATPQAEAPATPAAEAPATPEATNS